jgi:GT2 family glycosyltransferase
MEHNLGFAAANNLAARRAGEVKWLALLNPDAFPQPDWLERLLAAADKHPDYAPVSVLDWWMPTIPAGSTAPGTSITSAGWPGGATTAGSIVDGERDAGEIFAPCAAAALYRRTAFFEADGFDEAYFCYFEDIDLGFRLRLLGYRCGYVADAVVRHVGSAVTGRRSPFSLYHGHRNLVWTWCKNMPGSLFWRYLLLHLLLNLGSVLWYTRCAVEAASFTARQARRCAVVCRAAGGNGTSDPESRRRVSAWSFASDHEWRAGWRSTGAAAG